MIIELGNLVSSEYTGNNKIHMGNGMGLSISHIGQASFVSFSYSSHSHVLHLQNLLHVSLITKTLLSVSQFCTNNAILVCQGQNNQASIS